MVLLAFIGICNGALTATALAGSSSILNSFFLDFPKSRLNHSRPIAADLFPNKFTTTIIAQKLPFCNGILSQFSDFVG